MIGMFAISKAGHDKNQIYIILDEKDEYVYLVDGKLKPLAHPKKKNKKHIQMILKYENQIIADKIKSNLPVQNEEIKRAIKMLAD